MEGDCMSDYECAAITEVARRTGAYRTRNYEQLQDLSP